MPKEMKRYRVLQPFIVVTGMVIVEHNPKRRYQAGQRVPAGLTVLAYHEDVAIPAIAGKVELIIAEEATEAEASEPPASRRSSRRSQKK